MRPTHRKGYAELLGIPVDRCSPVEFRLFLDRALASRRAQRIVTLNPEIALAAHRNPRFLNIVRTADLITVDGVGVMLALRVLGYGHRPRLTGSDILHELCAYAATHHAPIAFLLRDDGLTAPPVLRAALLGRWPGLTAAFGIVDSTLAPDTTITQAVNDHAPVILVMNIGGMAQEEWITAYAGRFPSVRVIIGVGGAVDYLCGTVASPPAWVRRYGLEWAWRLVRQPWRWRRIANAAVVFPLAVLRWMVATRIRVPRFRLRLRRT